MWWCSKKRSFRYHRLRNQYRYDFPAKRTATNTIVTFMAALNKQKCYIPPIVSDTSIGVVILPQVPLQIKYHSNHDIAEALQSLRILAMTPWRLTMALWWLIMAPWRLTMAPWRLRMVLWSVS